jgi:4-amino-4-deoxy-L-arabinose transferase-like glycosyltransferase
MSQRLPGTRSRALLLLLLTAAALLLRAWRLGDAPLFADEAYYLLWSGRLAPGYYDHPAGVALLLRLSTLLGGSTEMGVRWLNALLSAACAPLLYLVGRRYVSEPGGWIGAVAVAFGPVYILTGRIVYPDTLQYTFLLLNLLALAPLLRREGPIAEWAWFGLTLGLLLNVKGTSLLYVGALAVYVLGWRRAWRRDPRAWLGAGVAALVFLPWLIWAAGHDWPSLRLALNQGSGFGMARPGLLASGAHAWRYLTPPAVILAAMAALGAATGAARLWKGQEPGKSLRQPPDWVILALASGMILLPMILSAADSPRNLALGLLPLWPLAALLPGPDARSRARRLQLWAWIALCAWLALHGIGTVAALLSPVVLPHSSGADAIRRDSAGWPRFGHEFAAPKADLLFAVDYSIAAQVAHYVGRPVYSSLGQFRFWGVPDAENWTVLAQGHIPETQVTERLRRGFESVDGPDAWRFADEDGEKIVYIWRAAGRRLPTAQLLDDLDFLALAREAAESRE